MKKVQIDLSSLRSVGRVLVNSHSEGLFISASHQNIHFHEFNQPLNSYVKLPGRYKLPLQIDLTVNVNIPGFYLILGNGHISFGTRKDNRSLGDLLKPDCKKPRSFSNGIKLNQDIRISIIYGLRCMQIDVDGEARYFSKKEVYMRSEEFSETNKKGFELMIAPDKQSKIAIKEISITEHDNEPNIMPYGNIIKSANLANNKETKVDFEKCIFYLSKELQDELRKMDTYLLSEKSLKIKRRIEGDHHGCKITYTSQIGFSYSLLISDELLNHFFWWYMLSNYKFENKYGGRKNDLTNETLKYAYDESPEITSRLVSYYDQCCKCRQGPCVSSTYEYQNRKIVACHGKMFMNMELQTFSDLRFMFQIIQKIISQTNTMN